MYLQSRAPPLHNRIWLYNSLLNTQCMIAYTFIHTYDAMLCYKVVEIWLNRIQVTLINTPRCKLGTFNFNYSKNYYSELLKSGYIKGNEKWPLQIKLGTVLYFSKLLYKN